MSKPVQEFIESIAAIDEIPEKPEPTQTSHFAKLDYYWVQFWLYLAEAAVPILLISTGVLLITMLVLGRTWALFFIGIGLITTGIVRWTLTFRG